jgi:predicted GH43/DUF377 family glycosyl hydrolase
MWTDDFADETKVFSKSNTEVVGGIAWIQVLASDYNWQKQGMVMDTGGPSDPDGKSVSEPWILKGPDGLYRMWYTGVTESTPQYSIMHATSWDGYTWEKHGSVLTPGFSGTGSDSDRVYSPCVIDEGSQYRMYYTGVSGITRITLMAVSTDGISWSYDGLAINVGGSGETVVSGYASVLEDVADYKAWYSGVAGGGNYQIFHATSPDAVTWTKQGLVLPNGPPGAPDDFSIVKNAVLKNSTGRYRMWYSAVGTDWSVLYAESPDGVDWTDRRGIVLGVGGLGDYDEVKATMGTLRLPVNMAGWLHYTGRDGVIDDRLMIATMGSLGNLTSTTIAKTAPDDWDNLFLNKTIVPNEAEVLVSVLNANTLRPYPSLI